MSKLAMGRRVHYVLTAEEAAAINEARTEGRLDLTIAAGVQKHAGNPARAGDVLPLDIVRVFPHEFGEYQPGVNGQVLLDGNDRLWVTSRREGRATMADGSYEPGTWHWPPHVD